MSDNKLVDLLNLMRGPKSAPGLRIVTVSSTEPDPITLVFEGTKLALGLEIFKIPVGCYPLIKGDRLLTFPLIGEEVGQRWAVVTKLNGGVVLATMQSATSLKVDGMEKVYLAADLVIPSYFAVSDASSVYSDSYTGKQSDEYLRKAAIQPLKAGDRVSIAPTWASGIKYAVLQRY